MSTPVLVMMCFHKNKHQHQAMSMYSSRAAAAEDGLTTVLRVRLVHGTPQPQPPLYSIVQVYPNVTHKSRVITNRGDGIFNVC